MTQRNASTGMPCMRRNASSACSQHLLVSMQAVYAFWCAPFAIIKALPTFTLTHLKPMPVWHRLPFFFDFLALIGAFSVIPVEFVVPCFMYLRVSKQTCRLLCWIARLPANDVKSASGAQVHNACVGDTGMTWIFDLVVCIYNKTHPVKEHVLMSSGYTCLYKGLSSHLIDYGFVCRSSNQRTS